MTRVKVDADSAGRHRFTLYANDGDDKGDAIGTRSYGTAGEASAAADRLLRSDDVGVGLPWVIASGLAALCAGVLVGLAI